MSDTKPDYTVTSQFVSSIVFDIIVTLVTCGIYNLFIQNRQINALNYLLNQAKYSFWKWFLFTIITCGIYHIYHEYLMAGDINSLIEDKSPNFQPMILLLAVFGLPIVADAIMQSKLNKHFGFEQI